MKEKHKKPYIKPEIEIWRVGYESKRPRTHKQYVKYDVSNLGRVKRNGKLVEPQLNKKGYLRISHFNIHKLVADAFISNTEGKQEVDHIDGNKTNNRADNLRWVTHIENMNNPVTLEKMSEKRKGNKNPMYGKHPTWMNNGITNVRPITKEKVEHYLELGYHFGRILC